jgi:phage shock protein E
MTYTYRILAVIGLAIGLAACSNQAEPEVAAEASAEVSQDATASIEEMAWTQVREGALLVDVRSQAEFDAGHLEGALHIPHDEITARAAELGDDMNRAIVVYCRSGHRSGLAQESLNELGFVKVHNGGGFEGMRAAK